MKKIRNILIKQYEDLDFGFLHSCDAVAETLGGNGMLAILDNNDSAPKVVKDGVSVIKAIRFENKTQNYGALQAIAGSARALQHAGDSTTTTAVFMQGYLRGLPRSKWNKKVEDGINIGVEEVYKHLSNLSKRTTKKDLKQIAKVSLNNDEKLANIVMQAFDYAGSDGIVQAVVKKDKEFTEFLKQDGMLLDSHGYASPYFANIQDKKLCYEGENVSILCSATWEYDQKIINKVKEFYDNVPRNTPLTIFLERSNSDMTEKLKGIKNVGFNINLVATNGYDEFESETLLKDIALLTGASVYNPSDPNSTIIFGIADKLVSTVENTSIIVNEVPIEFRNLLETIKNADKKDDRRIKRLTTKASLIEVGGLTGSSAVEIYERVDDCINAIKTASVEGFVAGGGSTFVYISGLMNTDLKHKERQLGYSLVKHCLKEPMLRILKNSNRSNAKKWEIWKTDYLKLAKENYGYGYDCIDDEAKNLIDAGIIDSKKSLRIALESATERAIQMFNISVIVHNPEKLEL